MREIDDFNQQMYSDNWLQFAAGFPVLFANVREEDLIDKWIADQLPMAARGIMISSGGCTAALLSQSGKFKRLHLVDANRAQLALSFLKLSLVEMCDSRERMQILGHTEMSRADRSLYLADTFRKTIYTVSELGPDNLVVSAGPDKLGRYELLFRRLTVEIASNPEISYLLGLSDPQKQCEFLDDNPQFDACLKAAFDSVMSLSNLKILFGETATQNMAIPFSEHFYRRTVWAIRNLPAAKNPYLAQLLSGNFRAEVFYPWLDVPKTSSETEVQYHHCAMGAALHESEGAFDFIHLSNILDWLSVLEAENLLKTAVQKLKHGGWIVIRQLNSSLNIPGLCFGLTWEKELSADLQKRDRSFFYPNVYVARKI